MRGIIRHLPRKSDDAAVRRNIYRRILQQRVGRYRGLDVFRDGRPLGAISREQEAVKLPATNNVAANNPKVLVLESRIDPPR